MTMDYTSIMHPPDDGDDGDDGDKNDEGGRADIITLPLVPHPVHEERRRVLHRRRRRDNDGDDDNDDDNFRVSFGDGGDGSTDGGGVPPLSSMTNERWGERAEDHRRLYRRARPFLDDDGGSGVGRRRTRTWTRTRSRTEAVKRRDPSGADPSTDDGYGDYYASPLYQGYGTHYVDLWIGTPVPQRQTVIVDTGSGMPAVPCRGHGEEGSSSPNKSKLFGGWLKGSGGKEVHHSDEDFEPELSDTFFPLRCGKCNRGECSSDSAAVGPSWCALRMSYEEGSSWEAYEARDVAYVGGYHDGAITPSKDLARRDLYRGNDDYFADSIQNSTGIHDGENDIDPSDAVDFAFPLVFACQTSIKGLFLTQLADGILGMDRSASSLWRQMRDDGAMGKGEFSLCFGGQEERQWAAETHIGDKHQKDDESRLREGSRAGIMTLGGVDDRWHREQMKYANSPVDAGNGAGQRFFVRVRAVYLRDESTSAPSRGMYDLGLSERAINAGGVMVDSGTTDTYFVRGLGAPFREAWEKLAPGGMKEYHAGQMRRSSGVRLTDYELHALPTVIFRLAGAPLPRAQPAGKGDDDDYQYDALAGDDDPEDVFVYMPASNYMEYDAETDSYHARFYADEERGSVLGANVMMGHDVHFDADNGRIGWAKSDCDYGRWAVTEEGTNGSSGNGESFLPNGASRAGTLRAHEHAGSDRSSAAVGGSGSAAGINPRSDVGSGAPPFQFLSVRVSIVAALLAWASFIIWTVSNRHGQGDGNNEGYQPLETELTDFHRNGEDEDEDDGSDSSHEESEESEGDY